MDRISDCISVSDVFFCLRVDGDISGAKRLKSVRTYERQFTVCYVNNPHGHGYSPFYYCSGGCRGRARGGRPLYFQTVLMPDGPKKKLGELISGSG